MDEAGQRASQLLRERIAREIFFWKARAVGRENRREERAILTDIASNHDMPFCARCTGKRGGELSIMALQVFRMLQMRVLAHVGIDALCLVQGLLHGCASGKKEGRYAGEDVASLHGVEK